MSGKRPSLAESMKQAVGPSRTPLRPGRPSGIRTAATGRPAGDRVLCGERAGKKKVTAALDPVMHKQLKSLAVERDTTTEALLVEAIADLFAKHGINRSA